MGRRWSGKNLFAAQTPQAADRALLLGALKSAVDAGAAVPDECMALERIGVRPVLVPTAAGNLKITAPEDLRSQRQFWKRGSAHDPRGDRANDAPRLTAGRKS